MEEERDLHQLMKPKEDHIPTFDVCKLVKVYGHGTVTDGHRVCRNIIDVYNLVKLTVFADLRYLTIFYWVDEIGGRLHEL